jgi:methyl-accepting chemotaxis protein
LPARGGSSVRKRGAGLRRAIGGGHPDGHAINFRGSVHDRAIALRDVTLARTSAEMSAALDEITALRAFYEQAAGPLDAMVAEGGAEERALLGSIKEIEAATEVATARVIALRRSGAVEQAPSLLLDEASPGYSTWLARINAFIDLQEAANQKLGNEARGAA